jgi:hypothetical protein
MTELACIGHWYTDLLYLVPVLLMGVFVLRDKIRTKRRAAQASSSSAAAATARVKRSPARSKVPL